MKPATVKRIVDASGDWMQARARAASYINDTQALRVRMEALETVTERLIDALLEGTSADPNTPPKKTNGGKK